MHCANATNAPRRTLRPPLVAEHTETGTDGAGPSNLCCLKDGSPLEFVSQEDAERDSAHPTTARRGSMRIARAMLGQASSHNPHPTHWAGSNRGACCGPTRATAVSG